MLKAQLRKLMLQKRSQYSGAEVELKSGQICQQFFSLFRLENIKTLHIFLPIQHKNEVNTWPIIQKLRTEFQEIQIAVSVADTQKYTLSHFWLEPGTSLVLSKWGIPEPENAKVIEISTIDLVLVPLLAFDEMGHRVGYGKGFYDRFLADCKPQTLKVGLSFELPIKNIIDFHEGDVVLDYAIIPEQVFTFKN